MEHRLDLARAYRLVLESGVPGACYNAASEQSVRVGDLASAIQSRFDCSSPIQVEPVETGVAELGAWVNGTVL